MGGMVEAGASASVKLPESVVDGLKAEARRAKKSVATLLNEFLEDREAARAGDAALKRFRDGGAKAVPHSEVKRRLGLAD